MKKSELKALIHEVVSEMAGRRVATMTVDDLYLQLGVLRKNGLGKLPVSCGTLQKSLTAKELSVLNGYGEELEPEGAIPVDFNNELGDAVEDGAVKVVIKLKL